MAKAKEDVRKRSHKPLETEERGNERYFRMLNAMDKDSYARPHKHPNEACVESFRSLRGKAQVVFFNESGEITDIQPLDDETENEVQIPPNRVHTIVATEDCVLYEEMKQPADGYQSGRDKIEPEWAPVELIDNKPPSEGIEYLGYLRQRVRDLRF